MTEHMFRVLRNNYVVNIYYLFFLLLAPFSSLPLQNIFKIPLKKKTAHTEKKKFFFSFFMACFCNPLLLFLRMNLFIFSSCTAWISWKLSYFIKSPQNHRHTYFIIISRSPIDWNRLTFSWKERKRKKIKILFKFIPPFTSHHSHLSESH